MSRETDDKDLLARLNALKSSTVTLEHTQTSLHSQENSDDNNDIARRFLALRKVDVFGGGSQEEHSDPATDHISDEIEPLQDMLKEFKAQHKGALASNDDKRSRILLAQARLALKDQAQDEHPDNQSERLAGNEKPSEVESGLLHPEDVPADENEEDTFELDEDAEADEILAQILDEVNLDEPDDAETLAQGSQSGDGREDYEAAQGFELPTAPSAAPLSKDIEDSTAFALPSAPKSIPDSASLNSSLRKFSDAEIETWCEICQADAEVRCIGCDGELYCIRCWQEGHTGPDVGYEERKHRCVQYTKPGNPEKATAV